METMLNNFINGNISTARKQAKRFDGARIASTLVTDYGFSEVKARLTAYFLKTEEGFQAACDAE